MTNKNYTFHPGRPFQLNFDDLEASYPTELDCQSLVSLTGKQIAYLLALTSVFPLYHWVWGLPSPRADWPNETLDKWDDISAFIDLTNRCLMSGCNVDDLLIKMDNLISVVNNVALNVSVSGGGGGCCGQVTGGTVLPSEPGTEGQPPPTGFETLPDAVGSAPYQSRKCKLANLIHEQTKEMVNKLDEAKIIDWVESVAGSSRAVLVNAAIGYIIGELSTPVPILDGLLGAVIGGIATIVVNLFADGVDLAELKTALATYEEDLVCALYSATSAGQATNDYLQVLADNGVTLANREIILAIFVPRLINIIFFGSSEVDIEESLDSYSGPVDCSGCAVTCPITISIGTLQSGALVPGQSAVIQSEIFEFGDDEEDRHTIRLTTGGLCCMEITVDSTSGWVAPFPAHPSGFSWRKFEGPGSSEEVVTATGTNPQGTTTCQSYSDIISHPSNQFTATISVTGECTCGG